MTEPTSTKTVKPLGNRVLAKRLESEEVLPGGIIIPDSAKQKQESAEVIAVGPGKRDKDGNLIPMPVKVGDHILFDKYAGQEINIDDEQFIVASADDIIATVE